MFDDIQWSSIEMDALHSTTIDQDAAVATTSSVSSMKRRRVSIGSDSHHESLPDPKRARQLQTGMEMTTDRDFLPPERLKRDREYTPSMHSITPSPSLLSVIAFSATNSPFTALPEPTVSKPNNVTGVTDGIYDAMSSFSSSTDSRYLEVVSSKRSPLNPPNDYFSQESGTVGLAPVELSTRGDYGILPSSAGISRSNNISIADAHVPLSIKRNLRVLLGQLTKARQVQYPVSVTFTKTYKRWQGCQRIVCDLQLLATSLCKPRQTPVLRKVSTIILDLFLVGAMLLFGLLVFQGISMQWQWKYRIHFANDDCIYVTVNTSNGWLSVCDHHAPPSLESIRVIGRWFFGILVFAWSLT
jgi:hypothetical protein